MTIVVMKTVTVQADEIVLGQDTVHEAATGIIGAGEKVLVIEIGDAETILLILGGIRDGRVAETVVQAESPVLNLERCVNG